MRRLRRLRLQSRLRTRSDAANEDEDKDCPAPLAQGWLEHTRLNLLTPLARSLALEQSR